MSFLVKKCHFLSHFKYSSKTESVRHDSTVNDGVNEPYNTKFGQKTRNLVIFDRHKIGFYDIEPVTGVNVGYRAKYEN